MYYWDWKKLEWPSNLIAVVLGEEYLECDHPDDMLASIHYIVATLPESISQVIFWRFKYGKTLQETAELSGIKTRERVRQIQARGLQMLRNPSRSKYFRVGVAGIVEDTSRKVGSAQYKRGYVTGWLDKERHSKFALCDNDIRTANPDDVTIEKLNLSVRSYNCLSRVGVCTLADILSMSEHELLCVRNLGRKSFDEIASVIASLGYSLRQEDGHESERT